MRHLAAVTVLRRSAYPVAELLKRMKVPFVFATGYSASEVPREYADVVYLGKPLTTSRITAALVELTHSH